MAARVLVTSAGSAPGNNLVRSLRAGPEPVFVIGCHSDQFVLRNSPADRNYLIPPIGHPKWTRALRHILATEAVQIVIPAIDADVAILSRERKRLGPHLFLPSAAVVDTCQDKYSLYEVFRANGIAVAETRAVTELTKLRSLFRQLGEARPLWCRVRKGAGALGALPVRTPQQAAAWIRYWGEMRGVPASSFLLSEYLPGRDFGCQSLWKNGELILIKCYERLSYLGTGSQPAEISSVAALAKTVIDRRVTETCIAAVRVLDARASGLFSIDLKENAQGVPCITEINCGRFSSATNILDLAGAHNMATTFVRLACGGAVDIADPDDSVADWYMLRDIDSAPAIFHASKFSDSVIDALHGIRSAPSQRRNKKGASAS